MLRQRLTELLCGPVWRVQGAENQQLTSRCSSNGSALSIFRATGVLRARPREFANLRRGSHLRGRRTKRKESAGKPGSVVGNHSSGTRVAARLKRPTRKHARAARCSMCCLLPYLVLLRAGFAVPVLLPGPRCALTAPFHPCQPANGLRRSALCCTFRGLAPPRRYLAPCPVEPGLSSPLPPDAASGANGSSAIAWPTPRAR